MNMNKSVALLALALVGISPISAEEATVATPPTSTPDYNVVTHTIDSVRPKKTTCLNPNYYASVPEGQKGEKSSTQSLTHTFTQQSLRTQALHPKSKFMGAKVVAEAKESYIHYASGETEDNAIYFRASSPSVPD